MVFKKIIPVFFVLLLFSSCWDKRDPEAENELLIINATSDTIFFTEKYKSSNRTYYMMLPYEQYRLGGNYMSSVFDIIREHYQRLDIEIEIYKIA